MLVNQDYKKAREKLDSDLKRYKSIVKYFQENPDRIFLKDNQTHLTRLYAKLIKQHKLNPSLGFEDLSNKLHNLVGGPNYLLGFWEEMRNQNVSQTGTY